MTGKTSTNLLCRYLEALILSQSLRRKSNMSRSDWKEIGRQRRWHTSSVDMAHQSGLVLFYSLLKMNPDKYSGVESQVKTRDRRFRLGICFTAVATDKNRRMDLLPTNTDSSSLYQSCAAWEPKNIPTCKSNNVFQTLIFIANLWILLQIKVILMTTSVL